MRDKFEFYYRVENVAPNLDNSFVKDDEKLMSLGSFYGYDNLIGEETFFEISSPNLRESVNSVKSRCINRIRQLIVALASYHKEDLSISLSQLLVKYYQGKKILLLESHSYFASIFKFYCRKYEINLYSSEFLSTNATSGEIIDGTLHVDIQNTKFPENYFDLILHTDVFEHVPDAVTAEREVARILNINGVVIFTVPFDYSGEKDTIYAVIEEGEVQYLKEPIYHEDPVSIDGKCLVYRIFSLPDMFKRYKENGCSFYCEYFHSKYLGIIGNDAYVFVGIKDGK